MPVGGGKARQRLTVVSLNVRGIKDRNKQKEFWTLVRDHPLLKHADIILLQETHLPQGEALRLFNARYPDWIVLEAGEADARTRSRGVATILTAKGIARGATLAALDRQPQGAPAGTALACNLAWEEHNITVLNIYSPLADKGQAEFYEAIGAWYRPMVLAPRPRAIIMGGDYNFTARPTDKLPEENDPHKTCRDNFRRLFTPGMADPFEVHQPDRRAFTWGTQRTFERLDRFYLSAGLLPLGHVKHGHLPGRPDGTNFTDHSPVILELYSQQAAQTGSWRPRRAKVDFLEDPILKENLKAWIVQTLDDRPARESPAEFIKWWMTGFKPALLQECSARSRQAAQTRTAALTAAQATLEAASSAQGIAAAASTKAAVTAITRARSAYSQAYNGAANTRRLQQRREWLHSGERPSPTITARLNPPKHANNIPAMRTEDGRVTTDGTRIVATLARHLAETSKLPLTEAAATDHLCAATTGRVPATAAASVGSPTIPPEEITKALTQTPSGKSPGPDGIPADLYRELASTFAPAFQALFETILRDGAPPGFNDGLVVTLYKKKGDPLSPGNYRPITLLNTDYKLFAKVFANRLIPALDPLVNQEQTAFLPGRYIGNNVRLLRELQAWAATHELGLGTVLCDFAKAYDTVSRDTLRRLFQTVGLAAAEPFLAVLMTNTTSRCHANGYLSRRFSLEAGVRQGCPASPLIYLVLAYALHCHLRGTRLGPTLFVVDTATRSCKPRLQVGPQFADDLDALIRTRSQIPRFLEGMQQFAAATGQHLNVAKTQLLHLGHPDHAPPGPTEHGLAVMPASTTVLGTPLGNPPAAFWTDKVAAAVAKLRRIGRLGMSMFGKAQAASTYGFAAAVFQMDFHHPPSAIVDTLDAAARQLINGTDPTSCPKFHACKLEILRGSPRQGGFGLLPLQAHLQGRQIKQAVTALLDLATPWVGLLQAQLCAATPKAVSWHSLVAVAVATDERRVLAWAPGRLRTITAPCQLLGPIGRLADPAKAPAPGDWCRAVPLWLNPLIAPPDDAFFLGHLPYGILTGTAVHAAYNTRAAFDSAAAQDAIASVGIQTIEDLIRKGPAVRRFLEDASRNPQARPQPPWPTEGWHCILRAGADCATVLTALERALPTTWQTAAQDSIRLGRPAPNPTEAEQKALGFLGWPTNLEAPPLPKYTVAAGTRALQEWTVKEAKWKQWFQVMGLNPADHPDRTAMLALFDRVWHLRWCNRVKETYWRFIYNGLELACRFPNQPSPCEACPECRATRVHVFWECQVARALVQDLEGIFQPGRPITCRQIWLLEPPPPPGAGVVPQQLWDMVGLATLAALWATKRMAYACRKEGKPIPVQTLVRTARVKFWDHVTDFCRAAALSTRDRKRLHHAQLQRPEGNLWVIQVDAATLELRPQPPDDLQDQQPP